MEAIAPYMINLQSLHLAGSLRVTHQGVWAIIRQNLHGLRSLGLEGLSPKFVSQYPGNINTN